MYAVLDVIYRPEFWVIQPIPIAIITVCLLLASYELITNRTVCLIFTLMFIGFYLHDAHHHAPIYIRVSDLLFLAYFAIQVGKRGPWIGPRGKRLGKAVGAKARAILKKIKDAMPKARPAFSPAPA